MANTILRLPCVKRKTGRCATSVYNDVRAGHLTKPVRIGQRSVGWPESEVDAVIAARIAGKSDAEIAKLVQHLHEARKHAGLPMSEQTPAKPKGLRVEGGGA